MGQIPAITQISSILGLLGLLAYFAFHYLRTRKGYLDNPEILKELLSAGITEEQARTLDKETLANMMTAKGHNMQFIARYLLKPEMAKQERFLLYFFVFMVCLAVGGIIFKDDPKAQDQLSSPEPQSAVLKGSVFWLGSPLAGVVVSLHQYNKSVETNKSGVFSIQLEDEIQPDSMYPLHFQFTLQTPVEHLSFDTSIRWYTNRDQQLYAVVHRQSNDKKPAAKGTTPVIPQPPTNASVKGTIMDKDGKPLAGAKIVFQGKHVAITDSNGAFSFELKGAYEDDLIIDVSWNDKHTQARVGRLQDDAKITL